MEINLVGRVNNLSLPASSALMPIFEAVVNSIQAIEDLKSKSKGKIEIQIKRGESDQNELELGDRLNRPIVGFEIHDNGIGFDNDNFTSFDTSDSRWKQSRGGKGIGRLFWLKAFDKVEIESVFDENGKSYKRLIDFSLSGVASKPPEATEAYRKTVVRLSGFKEEYRSACKKRASSIATRIVEHCLIYFLHPDCPEIILADDDEDHIINLNVWFKENIGENLIKEKFGVKKQEFELVGLPLYSSEENTSRLHWCSNNREVKGESLARLVPNLRGKIKDTNGKSFVFIAYLYGEYLDKNTNAERSAFNIPEEELPHEEGVLSLDMPPSQQEIRGKAAEVISKLLKDRLEPISVEKRQQVEKFVAEVAPQYRPLITYEPGILDSIPPGLSEDKLDLELHKAHHSLEVRLKEEGKKVFEMVSNPSVPTEQKEQLEKQFFEKVSAVNQAHLAKYVLSRKMILDIYEGAIKQKSDGSFDREDVIHNLIFPRYRTSNQIGFEQHNLWLLDERLAYHHYLASEKDMAHLEPIESESKGRPDVIVFNQPAAFSEGEAPYSSVVIIEFKRPGREDSTRGDRDPIHQMFDYCEEVRAGKIRAADGQQLLIPSATPFFLYLACDLTEDIRKVAKGKGLQLTSDGLGFFGYNANYQAYVEVLSYRKIGFDARKRNRIFFDKLGIS